MATLSEVVQLPGVDAIYSPLTPERTVGHIRAVRKSSTPILSLRGTLRKALKAATPTLREIAKDAGLTYSAVRLYARGKRTPAPAVVARLAKALRARSGRLAQLADELEAAARVPTPRRKS